MQLFIGNHKRIMNRKVYVKTMSGFASGRIEEYYYKSRRYRLRMDGGGCCYTKKVYITL